jgi:hypothetical protein
MNFQFFSVLIIIFQLLLQLFDFSASVISFAFDTSFPNLQKKLNEQCIM